MSDQPLEALVVREKDGKSYWTKVGIAFPGRDGVSYLVRLDALPIDGVLHLRPRRARQEQQPSQSRGGDPTNDTASDDVPF